MGIKEQGIEGERWFIEKMIEKGIPVFQPDAITLENGKYIINEIKRQSYFKKPPFDGHGLPKWQIEARIKFWKTTGIRVRLLIKDNNIIYYQWLDILEEGEYFDTQGNKKRRIYPLISFKSRIETE